MKIIVNGVELAVKGNTLNITIQGDDSPAHQETCIDLTNNFKVYTVPRESEISPFVESKTSRDYVIGQAYFQLTKPELLRRDRRILLMDDEGKVWGGQEAKRLIGLPMNQDAEITPKHSGNGKFTVFVESRSVNRKLVRGTKLLVDTAKTVNETPTWGES